MSVPSARIARDHFLEALRQGDAEVLEPVVDDRFTFTDPRGRVLVDREGLIKFVRARRLRFDRVEVVDETAHEQKDGTVRFQSTVHLDGSLDGVRYNGRYRMIDVYRDSGNGWAAVLSAAQLVSAPE